MSFVTGKPLVLVAIVVAVIVAGAAAFMLMGGGGAQTTTTTTQSQAATTTTTTTSQPAGQVSLEGYWHGTYRSEKTSSRGEFCFHLTRADSGYTGMLAINDEANVYVGTGIPLAIKVSGNAITLGWVAGPSVTFSGTISGDSMQGTWQISGGQYSDQGTWSASKGRNAMCGMLEATTTPPMHTTTTSASPQEIYDAAPDLEATGDLTKVDDMVRQLLGGIFGGVKLAEQGQTMGHTYGLYIVPRPLTVNDGNAIIQGIQSMGYQIGMMSGVSSEGVYVVAALPDGSMLTITAEMGKQEISVVYTGTTGMTTTPPVETTTTTTFVNQYDSVTDMQASGVLAAIDPMLRQAFEQVFGGAKLESITDSGDLYTDAVYIVPRQISHTDADTLVQALQQAGFQVTDWYAEQGYFRIYVSVIIEGAEHSASIEFMGDYETQRLDIHVEKTPSPQDQYNAAQDLQPLGILAEVDPALRLIFEQMFGGVKLISQTSYGAAAYGEYIVPRPVAQDDAVSMVQLLEQANFTNVFPQIDSAGAYIMATTGSYTVTIQLTFGSQTIQVMVAQG